MSNLDDQLAAFKAAMDEYELIPPSKLSCDARIHRCNAKGHGGEKDGAYFLAVFGGYLTGWFQNWQLSEEYQLFTPDYAALTHAEKIELEEQIALGKMLADDERREREINAKQNFKEFMASCVDHVPHDHPYCKAKKVGGAPGVKTGTWKNGVKEFYNYLIVPIEDGDGKLISCQGIAPDGSKRLFPGIPLKDGRCVIGKIQSSKCIIITESYANAYSLHKALEVPTVATFGTGRMLEICLSIRKKYPEHRLIIAADNDYAKRKLDGSLKPNAGVLTANKILAAIPEASMIPAPEEDGKDSTDWNEHINFHGYGSAREYFAEYTAGAVKRLFYADELEMATPQWLVGGYLEKDSLGCMYGPSGVGKSYIAVELACSVASGVPFMGDIRVEPGMVVYVVGEGYRGFTRRKCAWVNNKAKENIHPNLHKLIVSKGSFQLLDSTEMESLVEEIDHYSQELQQTPALIIVDTLARNFGDGDENSTQDMSAFINVVDRKLKDRYGCCVLIVHHTGHDKTRARGNGALKAALDTELHIAKADYNESVICMSATKTKDGSIPPIIDMSFVAIDLEGEDNFGGNITSAVVTRASKEDLEALLNSKIVGDKSYGHLVNQIGSEGATKKDLIECGWLPADKADHALAALVRTGKLALEDGTYTSKGVVMALLG